MSIRKIENVLQKRFVAKMLPWLIGAYVLSAMSIAYIVIRESMNWSN